MRQKIVNTFAKVSDSIKRKFLKKYDDDQSFKENVVQQDVGELKEQLKQLKEESNILNEKISEIERQIYNVSNFKNIYKEYRIDIQSNCISPDEYFEYFKSRVKK